MTYRYIVVEGNIGSGKTTLATLLGAHYNAHLILEEFEDNNFLPKFYKEPERYAFPLELSFLADRYKQLKEQLLNKDIFEQPIVADYTLAKSKLFARINLSESEYELFERLFEIIDPNLPAPDLLIYLHAPIDTLRANIIKRGRSYEQNIPDTYLKKVDHVYQEYLKIESQKKIIIDTTNVDFLADPAQFSKLIDFLNKKPDSTTHLLEY
jgi:deoxyguanosine kinase